MEVQDTIDAVPDDQQTTADAGAAALQSLDSGIVPDISPSSL